MNEKTLSRWWTLAPLLHNNSTEASWFSAIAHISAVIPSCKIKVGQLNLRHHEKFLKLYLTFFVNRCTTFEQQIDNIRVAGFGCVHQRRHLKLWKKSCFYWYIGYIWVNFIVRKVCTLSPRCTSAPCDTKSSVVSLWPRLHDKCRAERPFCYQYRGWKYGGRNIRCQVNTASPLKGDNFNYPAQKLHITHTIQKGLHDTNVVIQCGMH